MFELQHYGIQTYIYDMFTQNKPKLNSANDLMSPKRVFLDYLDIQVGSHFNIFDDFYIKSNKLKFEILTWPHSDLVVAAPAIAKSTNTLRLVAKSFLEINDMPLKLILDPKFKKNLTQYTKVRSSGLEKNLEKLEFQQSIESSGYAKEDWKIFDQSLQKPQREALYIDRIGDADIMFRNEMRKRLVSDEFIQVLNREQDAHEVLDVLEGLTLDRSFLFQRENVLSVLDDFDLKTGSLLFLERELNRGFNAAGATAADAVLATQIYNFDAMSLYVLARHIPYKGYESFASKIEKLEFSKVSRLANTFQWLEFRNLIQILFSTFSEVNEGILSFRNSIFSENNASLFYNPLYLKFLKSASLGTAVSLFLGLSPIMLIPASFLSGIVPAILENFVIGKNRAKYLKSFDSVCESLRLIERYS